MAKFIHKPKESQMVINDKVLPVMKKSFNYKGYLYRTSLVLQLGLLIYIAYKLS